jgi:uncharacterized Fe-S radical SAM superfamily protein PflX
MRKVRDGDVMSASTVNDIIEAVSKLQTIYPEKVLEKCTYCGQWGAVQCACPACGAPIDPKQNASGVLRTGYTLDEAHQGEKNVNWVSFLSST